MNRIYLEPVGLWLFRHGRINRRIKMKEVLNFIIMPDDHVGEDTKTITTHLLEEAE